MVGMKQFSEREKHASMIDKKEWNKAQDLDTFDDNLEVSVRTSQVKVTVEQRQEGVKHSFLPR
eukprot:scaffold228191_cov18-Tisochrysis_lutea.AAC.1